VLLELVVPLLHLLTVAVVVVVAVAMVVVVPLSKHLAMVLTPQHESTQSMFVTSRVNPVAKSLDLPAKVP
jgi:hypothetical protein